MKKLIPFVLICFLFNCNSSAQKKSADEAKVEKKVYPVTKTDAEWKAQLTEEQYFILRESGTERPFSSPLNKNYKKGVYHCAGCNTALFKSEHKFDSGSGWPSFDQAIEGNVAYGSDTKIGYERTEEHCATCGGHLGHLFNDGPKETTGQRHCIDGYALVFVPSEEE